MMKGIYVDIEFTINDTPMYLVGYISLNVQAFLLKKKLN